MESPTTLLANKDVSINLELVYDVAGNDVSFVTVMVETFLKNTPVTLQALQDFCAAGDWEGVYQKAHFAKSSFSIVSVSKILELLKQIEINARARKDLARIPALLSEIITIYTFAEALLQEHFSISKNESAAVSI